MEVCSFFSRKKGHLLLNTKSLLKNFSALVLISYFPLTASLRLVLQELHQAAFVSVFKFFHLCFLFVDRLMKKNGITENPGRLSVDPMYGQVAI